MSLLFINETQERRGLNRNNHHLIQQRATKVGAKTRSARANKRSAGRLSPNRNVESLTDEEIQLHQTGSLLSNAVFSWTQNNGLLLHSGRFTDFIQMTSSHNKCLLSSPLQRHLTRIITSECNDRNPGRPSKVSRLTTWQVLQYVTSRYGQAEVLNAAIDCLMSRIQEYSHDTPNLNRTSHESLVPPQRPDTRRLYGKALGILQKSLGSPKLQYPWETLYAIILLELYELLGSQQEHTWVLHAQGAIQMLAKIGPDAIQEEFHRVLVASQTRIFITEMIMSNEYCYLMEPKWQDALRKASRVTHRIDIHELNEAVLSIDLLSAYNPSAFKQVTSFMQGDKSGNEAELVSHLQWLLDQFRRWHSDWATHITTYQRRLDHGKQGYLYAANLMTYYWIHTTLAARFVVSMRPQENAQLEIEAAETARVILNTQGQMQNKNDFLILVGRFATKVAESVLFTTQEWSEAASKGSAGAHIDPAIFLRWSDLLRWPGLLQRKK